MSSNDRGSLRLVPASETEKAGPRMAALRKELGLTQDAVVRQAAAAATALGYEPIDRVTLSKIENGPLKLRHYEQRAILAAAFGLSTDDLSAYLDGRISLEEVLRRRTGIAAAPRRPVVRNRDRADWAALVAAAKDEDPTIDAGAFDELGDAPTYADAPLDARPRPPRAPSGNPVTGYDCQGNSRVQC